MTHGRAEIHELLLANDLHPSRALGQNFVADGNTVRRIVRLAGVAEGQPVVEIGAGLGSLTLALAEAGAEVTAVEIDRHVVPVLRSQVEPLGVRVVEADALTLDWGELLATDRAGAGGRRVRSPGRWWPTCPTTWPCPLVVRVLEEAPQVSSLLVMVQREVGERLAAGAGDEAYGAVSVKVAYWATASLVGRVPASVFIPRPRVESVLVRLDRRPEQAAAGIGRVPATRPTTGCSRWCGAASPTAARCCAARWTALVRPEAFEATGIRPDGPGRGTGTGRVGTPGRLASRGATRTAPIRPRGRPVSGPRPGGAAPSWSAPAKLTVSLRVTGAGVTATTCWSPRWSRLDLADTLRPGRRRVDHRRALRFDRGCDRRRSRRPRGAWRSGGIDPGPDNLVTRALGAVGRTGPGASWSSGSLPGPAWAVDRPMPPPSCGGRGAPTRRWPPTSGADVPFCLVGGRALVRGIGERVSPLPFEERAFTLFLLPFGVDTRAVYARLGRPAPLGQRTGHGLGRGVRRAGTAGGNDLEAAGAGRRAPPGPVAGPSGQADRTPAAAGRERVDVVRGGDPGRAGDRAGRAVVSGFRAGAGGCGPDGPATT